MYAKNILIVFFKNVIHFLNTHTKKNLNKIFIILIKIFYYLYLKINKLYGYKNKLFRLKNILLIRLKIFLEQKGLSQKYAYFEGGIVLIKKELSLKYRKSSSVY